MQPCNIESLVNELGGNAWLLGGLTAEGKLLYIAALMIRNNERLRNGNLFGG